MALANQQQAHTRQALADLGDLFKREMMQKQVGDQDCAGPVAIVKKQIPRTPLNAVGQRGWFGNSIKSNEWRGTVTLANARQQIAIAGSEFDDSLTR